MTLPRPDSLAEVARRSVDAGTFAYELVDFLHEFALRGEASMLAEQPEPLCYRYELGGVHDAYLAAAAVYLCGKLACFPPLWTRDPERSLREPWFASPGRHMRALLLVESPAAFRERNLFVTANALSVA
ncbi:MAG: hypothetical protein ACKV2U_18380 [Bryobacteraceae bacterium]